MALSASTVFEINSAATAANVNGGGFNPSNANMMTDLTTDTNTANTSAPVVKSASYNFVAGDVGNWLYIKSGTNWTPGWYKIQSVASNKATLEAAVGSSNVVQVNNQRYGTNTVIGCATVGTPTAGTFTIDYSQSTAAIISPADLASTGSSTTLTSASALFTKAMVGNLIHITTTGTGGFGVTGWYEIVSFSSASSVVTDRTTNSGTAMVAVTGNVGGAFSLGNASDASVFTIAIASSSSGSRYFVKGGSGVTYTMGAAISGMTAGNAAFHNIVESYVTVRGNRPALGLMVANDTRPTFAMGANAFTYASQWTDIGIIYTGTAATLVSKGVGLTLNCKFVNSSSTAGRAAFSTAGSADVFMSEAVSYRGKAMSITNANVYYNYIHDSDTSLAPANNGQSISGNIIACHVTAGIALTSTVPATPITNNTFYGAENKLGTAISMTGGANDLVRIYNNIFYGFSTGVSQSSDQNADLADFNDYYNNTTDVSSKFYKGANDLALNPNFTNVTQVTGTTATTTSGNHLIDSSASFITSGITPGQDYLYIKSGTGVTTGIYGILSVDSATQITTDIALSANATADKTYQITTGRNFSVGAGIKATGFPGTFPAGLTTGYMDIGAAQRQEPSGGSFTFIG